MQRDSTRLPGYRQAAWFTRQRITRMQNAGNDSLIRASLARLRRGIGKEPGSLPELWGETLEGLPADLAGQSGRPSTGEWAVYIALTLYALHQQGKDIKKECMHQEGQRLGLALRKLIHDEEDEQRIKRRFDQVVTADSPQELSHYLRTLVQLLKAGDVPLDYGSLASDLYLTQIPDARDGIRLQWGRDFYRVTFTKDLDETQDLDQENTEGEENHEE